jgi:uncharacterized protein YjdB
VRWTVADASIARIDSVGDAWVILRALRLGGTTVTAMTSGRTASARLVVDSVPRDTTGGPGGSVASVTVTPPGDTIAVGDSASFFAELRDAEGNPIVRPAAVCAGGVTWTVSDSTVARIADACGQWVLVRGLREGVTTVTATADGQSGSAHLVVTDSTPSEPGDSVASVTVRPPADTVAVGDSAAFSAELRDANGTLVSRPVTWTVGDSTVARIQGAFGQTVILRAGRAGTTTVTATSEGQSGTAQLVVTDSTPSESVATVIVTPARDTVAVGDSATFFADLRDAQGNPLSGRAVTWSVSDSAVARIEGVFGQSVILRGQGDGITTVTAMSEGQSGSAELIVMRPSIVASVTVTPPADTIAVGDSTTFVAELRDADGNPIVLRPGCTDNVTWTVSDSTVVGIVETCGPWVLVRGLREGVTTVVGTDRGGQSGSAHLVVTDSTPSEPGDSVASVTVHPTADTVAVGDSSGFFAELRDANGNVLSRPVTWTVGDSTVARIQSVFGQRVILRAQRPGSTTVTAMSEGQSGSAHLVVTDSTPSEPRDSVVSMTVRPPSDTLAVGDTATFFAEPRDAQGTFLGDRAITWTVGDSTVAQIERDFVQSVVIRARRPGSTTLTATSEGKSDSANVVVR